MEDCLKDSDPLRASIIRRWDGGNRSGSRVCRLHATGGIATPARDFTLAELFDGGREGRPVREHQCEAEQDGYEGLHARSV